MIKKSKIYAESWNVAFRKIDPDTSIIEDKETPFQVIKNPYRYWAADPFLFDHNGETYIFAELYDYCRRRGGIGYCKISDKKRIKWNPIIFEDFHISYPYVFEKDGCVFIMPESSTNNNLYLYKSIVFPDKWEKVHTIREGVKLADTTPFDLEDKRMALSYGVEDPFNPELMLIDFENPQNDKVLLCENVSLRRPAGRVLPNNIRPAQICIEDYGKGIVFYKYSFSEGVFSEVEVQRIYPSELSFSQKIYLDGMHTYNRNGSIEVIDIKTRRLNMVNLLSRIIGKIH